MACVWNIGLFLKKSGLVVAFAANVMFVDRGYINPCERMGVTLV